MRYCARDFMPAEIEIIRSLLAQFPRLNRYRLSPSAPAPDWHARYAYRPVLLETFVEKPRFTGTCWFIHVSDDSYREIQLQ
jgi:hypothetical protein